MPEKLLRVRVRSPAFASHIQNSNCINPLGDKQNDVARKGAIAYEQRADPRNCVAHQKLQPTYIQIPFSTI